MVSWSIETLVNLSPAFVFGIISIILAFKLRKKKSLAYDIVTDSSLIVGEAIKPEVDILFRGEKVEDVHLLEVKIINNGNEHVKEEDYKKPITFEFNSDTEIMDMSAEKRSSNSIQISFNLQAQNIVEITPNLLNKKDWFIAKFLLNKYRDFDLSLHAIDIGEIKEYKPPIPIFEILFYSVTITAICIVIWFVLMGRASLYFGPFVPIVFVFMAIGLALITVRDIIKLFVAYK